MLKRLKSVSMLLFRNLGAFTGAAYAVANPGALPM